MRIETRQGGRRPGRRLPLQRKILFSGLTVLGFFALLEALLALAGVAPGLRLEDPFVGFASDVPLFVETTDDSAGAVWTTAPNKRGFFNTQSFPRDKVAGTYRVFCLGGSTTYGRPYDDTTSFAGWLRELLPVSDADRSWEVINAGGISYASYRVAHLMQELVRYEPDLFVVYTGHNEFLEERTYGELRHDAWGLNRAASRLARTRLWTALSALFDLVRAEPDAAAGDRTLLPAHVDAKLDHSAGLELYERDDGLRDRILEHYRLSLERMVSVAGSAGARLVFVTPASNLKDCSPFKSQHTDGIGAQERTRSAELLATARAQVAEARGIDALRTLDAALRIDPRHAALHYERGRVLEFLGRTEEARAALERARDEDVCPLRALSSMQDILADVAREHDVPLVDFVDLVERPSGAGGERGIAGSELFLDHVHPTIEGHRMLALALIEALAGLGVVEPDAGWGEEAVAAVTRRVEAGLDRGEHARALANLALTLSWAGKAEESRRLAFQALESGVEDPTILAMVSRHYALEGDAERALHYMRRAVRANPQSPVAHSQLGLLHAGRGELEAAAAHFYLSTLLWEDNEKAHQQLGFSMAQRGRYDVALRSYLQAQRLSPANPNIRERIDAARSRLGDARPDLSPAAFHVTRHPSGVPHVIAQTLPDATGRQVADGIWTEWYENGDLKRFVDYAAGVPHGIAIGWDPDGVEISRVSYRNGAPIE